jgi:hypothetical protein
MNVGTFAGKFYPLAKFIDGRKAFSEKRKFWLNKKSFCDKIKFRENSTEFITGEKREFGFLRAFLPNHIDGGLTFRRLGNYSFRVAGREGNFEICRYVFRF